MVDGGSAVGGHGRMGAIRIKRRAEDSDSFQSEQSLRKDLLRAAVLHNVCELKSVSNK